MHPAEVVVVFPPLFLSLQKVVKSDKLCLVEAKPIISTDTSLDTVGLWVPGKGNYG